MSSSLSKSIYQNTLNNPSILHPSIEWTQALQKRKRNKKDVIRRACEVSLDFATQEKLHKLEDLTNAFRGDVNFFIRSLWEVKGKLNKETLARLPKSNSRLSQRYKSQALKQALDIVISTRKSAKALKKRVRCPKFMGSAILDKKFIRVIQKPFEKGSQFDLLVKISGLKKGKRIPIPTKGTKVLEKWLLKPDAKIVEGCCLEKDRLILWVEWPKVKELKEGEVPPLPKPDKVLAIDIGMCKLFVDSDGNEYGKGMIPLLRKIGRKRWGSISKKASFMEREAYIRKTIKELPWDKISVLGIERLRNMKHGPCKRGRGFKRLVTPWVYRRVITWIREIAQENGVLLVEIDPANTSRECPKCNMVSVKNRRGEDFRCIRCGYTADADFVGALNILARTLRSLGSLGSPSHPKSQIIGHKSLSFD